MAIDVYLCASISNSFKWHMFQNDIGPFYNNMCPDEKKGCSALDSVIFESCRAEHLLSNDIKYVMIG